MHLAINVVKPKRGYNRKPTNWDNSSRGSLDRKSRLGETSQLTTLVALQRFLPFKADDWNRNQRGGGVYPADMKHRIEDQAGQGYAGKVGTRISIRLSAPKAKSTGLRARHAEKRARAHSTTIQTSVTTCNRTIWRDICMRPLNPSSPILLQD